MHINTLICTYIILKKCIFKGYIIKNINQRKKDDYFKWMKVNGTKSTNLNIG